MFTGLYSGASTDAVSGRAASTFPRDAQRAPQADASTDKTQLLTDAGHNAYTGACAQCHGAKGDGKGSFGVITSPPATDLTSPAVRSKTDAELFWMIKNGLGFTAMPAFSGLYQDADIVAIVGYIRQLQDGKGQPADIPVPSTELLTLADPGGDPAHRGAAVFFAQGCFRCHGGYGEAPGDFSIQDTSQAENVIRKGVPGMPAFDSTHISDSQIKDVITYLQSAAPSQEQ